MANGNYQNVGYSLGQSPLQTLSSLPVIARRAPTTSDLNYQIGQLWIYSANNTAYILASVVNNQATWITFAAGGGAGSFTTLTSTGATTLATTGASTNSFGNTTGATALNLMVGTGNFTLDGVGASTYTIGSSNTTGTISIGGASETGAITLGLSTAGQTINVGNAINTGAQTVNIAGGAAGANSTVNILSGNGTAGVQTLNALTGTRSGVANIGTGAAAHTITIGSSSANNTTQLFSAITQLPGPVNIYTGAGAPNVLLAVHIGDLYINTTAASAVTRMYIATAVGTWTNITCAA